MIHHAHLTARPDATPDLEEASRQFCDRNVALDPAALPAGFIVEKRI